MLVINILLLHVMMNFAIRILIKFEFFLCGSLSLSVFPLAAFTVEKMVLQKFISEPVS